MAGTQHEVVIAGGGPAGMMLAAELALANVDVAIVERRPDQTLDGSRGSGFHARTVEILDQRGILDRFLAEGTGSTTVVPGMLGRAKLGMDDVPTRHPYTLALFQEEIERILAEWAAELGVLVDYGREVAGFAQDDAGVDVE